MENKYLIEYMRARHCNTAKERKTKIFSLCTLGQRFLGVLPGQIAFLLLGFFIASSVPFTRTFPYLLALFSILLLCGSVVGVIELILLRFVNRLALSIAGAFGIFLFTVYKTSLIPLLLYDYRPVQAIFLVMCIAGSVFTGLLIYLIGEVGEEKTPLLLRIVAFAGPVLIAGLYWADTNILVGIYPGAHLFLRILAYLLIDLFVRSFIGIEKYPRKSALVTATAVLVATVLVSLSSKVGRSTTSLAMVEKPISSSAEAEASTSFHAKAEKPRRVFIILIDGLPPDRLSCYGYSRKTSPNIDAMAKESTIFRYCCAPGSLTLESLPTLFTSRPLHHLLASSPPNAKDLVQDNPTIAGELKKNGFHTFVLAGLPGCGHDAGFEDIGNRGDFKVIEKVKKRAPKLDRSFGYIFYYSLHGVLAGKYLQGWMDKPGFKEYGAREMSFGKGRLNTYDTVIKIIDCLIGELLDYLKSEDLYDDSLIIITSDHGQCLGEHRYYGNGRSSYNGELLVPLIIKTPGSRHQIVYETVGLIDIFPTILDLMEMEAPDTIEGRSLVPFLFEKDYQGEPERVYFHGNHGGRPAIIKGDYKLMGKELYRFKSDPLEERNLFGDLPQVVGDLQNHLEGEPGL